jgi:hypothetical protein
MSAQLQSVAVAGFGYVRLPLGTTSSHRLPLDAP